MNKHLETVYKEFEVKYSFQKEYLQAILEFFESIDEVVENDPSIEASNIIRRVVEPDRSISFKVIWQDDHGIIQVNKGYKVQFNQALGPYKGGLRFNPKVNEAIFKFLAFEQTFKNALTGLPLGGSKGGADFDSRGKSDGEILRFCQAFMIELVKYSGPDFDIPAADAGVSTKEIGYMFGMYKKLTGRHNGVITSKGVNYGGSYVRIEATGYGLIYITEAVLNHYYQTNLRGKKIIISGIGNVSIPAAQKASSSGAKVIAMSSIDGVVYDENGLDVEFLKAIRDTKLSIKTYLDKYPNTGFNTNPKALWEVPCDIALPCATQNELELVDVKHLVKNNVLAVLEGANMPTTLDATHYLIDNKVLFVPGKVANAGGVTVSGFEMQQNATHTQWSFETVNQKLKEVMNNIFKKVHETAVKFNNKFDLVKGANITAFLSIYHAMVDQGL